ncbi:MAG: glycosyltransferase family 4 protein, partial [Anaerolineae bacterium]|nr:glycosyltransferase family 4 protein [Anaerolineae bacterium]
ESTSICFLPRLQGLGGPSSFQSRLLVGLRERGFDVHFDPERPDCHTILVFGGTSALPALWQARRRGVRIVQRLNGMNWLHRRRPAGLRFYLRSEANNWIIATIRRRLADRIIYQSNFVRSWWQTVYGKVSARSRVVYNGVDLEQFSPNGDQDRPTDYDRILLVEGKFRSGYEVGLKNGVDLVERLQQTHPKPLELMVVGQVSDDLKAIYQNRPVKINWAGVVEPERIPFINRSAHLLFSADLNAACPNSVVEGMACGLPVAGFATGALSELVAEEGGRVVPYGANFWKLEDPNITRLVGAASDILLQQDKYRPAARARAEKIFSLDEVIEKYLDSMLN